MVAEKVAEKEKADDLLALLRQRLLGLYSPLLVDVRYTILFTSGGLANWTVLLDQGRAFAHRGAPVDADLTVRAPLRVLRDVVSGERGGLAAFLAGDLTVRGNLALALELDGLFPGVRADDSRTLTRSVEAGGIRTFYLEAGPPDAPPVVLVHGLSATNASMLTLIPPLAEKYRVLAPDLPGHGGSQAIVGKHGAAFFGTWLHEFVRETCGGKPAVLIGNSLGGRTCLQTALDYPADVRGLVLLCPAVAFRRLRQAVPLVRIVRDETARLPFKIPRRLLLRGLRALFAEPSRLSQAWQDAAIDEFLRVMARPANRYSIFSALRHIYLDQPFGEGGFWDRLPSLQPPALFLWGDHDVLVPPGFHKFVSEALPEGRSIVLDDCGHVPQFEWPELTAQLSLDFIAGLPALAAEKKPARRSRKTGTSD